MMEVARERLLSPRPLLTATSSGAAGAIVSQMQALEIQIGLGAGPDFLEAEGELPGTPRIIEGRCCFMAFTGATVKIMTTIHHQPGIGSVLMLEGGHANLYVAREALGELDQSMSLRDHGGHLTQQNAHPGAPAADDECPQAFDEFGSVVDHGVKMTRENVDAAPGTAHECEACLPHSLRIGKAEGSIRAPGTLLHHVQTARASAPATPV